MDVRRELIQILARLKDLETRLTHSATDFADLERTVKDNEGDIHDLERKSHDH